MAKGVLAEIVARKRRDVVERLTCASLNPEPTRRSLAEALQKRGARFIMEVKKASPSGHQSSVSVEEAVDAYAPIADAISVLTDKPYFAGSLEDLRIARSRYDGPILAKDFIIDPRQVSEARLHGADAVLVILAILSDGEAGALLAEARRLNMDVIVEVHDEAELGRALALGAPIIGINNRNLSTLCTDLSVTEQLATKVPPDRIVISESGITDRREVERLASKVDAFLVGSSLMASGDVGEAARALVYGRVKICGVTNPSDAFQAALSGATHVGMIFAERSLRRIHDGGSAIAVMTRCGGAHPVGIFQDQDFDFVAGTAHELGLSAVQLHGNETGLDQLRKLLAEDVEIWAACSVAAEAERERVGADRILYDRPRGGAGKAFDWSLVAAREALPQAFLAGGIGPSNVAAAQCIGAYGIDVGSGVEASPGSKDPHKINALFEAARPACRRAEQCA